MINVTITQSRVKVSGHAGFGPPGADIVCAGVTALTDTLAMALEELTTDIITIYDDHGLMDIKFEDLSEAGKLLVGSFVIGTKAIAAEYPNNLCVRDDRPRRDA